MDFEQPWEAGVENVIDKCNGISERVTAMTNDYTDIDLKNRAEITVGDLIDLLSKIDPNLGVFIGYEGVIGSIHSIQYLYEDGIASDIVLDEGVLDEGMLDEGMLE